MKKLLVLVLWISSLPFLPAANAALPKLVINELQCQGVDWIEIYNPTSTQVDLSQWILTDRNPATTSLTAKHFFVFKTGTVIPAKGYKVVLQGTRVVDTEFGIDCTNQETIFLGRGSGVLWTEVDRVNPPVFDPGASYGRSTDGSNLWDMTYPTKGAANEPLLPKLRGTGIYTCSANKRCTLALKATSSGLFALTSPKTGVTLSSAGSLVITARKKQVLTLDVRITNQFGTTNKSITVKII